MLNQQLKPKKYYDKIISYEEFLKLNDTWQRRALRPPLSGFGFA
jgi:hypothetical protein